MQFALRFKTAARAAGIHLLCSFGVAVVAAAVVFGFWFPYPYSEFAGGRDLFLLIVSVDVVCGPLLTMVLFNPKKPGAELMRDLGLVVLIQLSALGYGVYTMWQARPLFLVFEVDRFKVVRAPDLDSEAVAKLPKEIRPSLMSGPILVGIRPPVSVEEKNKVLFDAVQGGRDYAERPEFYLPYAGAAKLQALKRVKPIPQFLSKYPDQAEDAQKIAAKLNKSSEQLVYVPVTARQDWIAILDEKAEIVGFLKGDGF